jgi:hypothetical protein
MRGNTCGDYPVLDRVTDNEAMHSATQPAVTAFSPRAVGLAAALCWSRYFGPVRSTMITALVPGLSVLGAVLILAEPLQWNLLAGLGPGTLSILFGVGAGIRR